MVGVPGRSKACNTCRLRKVSCSLERPRCRTCIKSSRTCTGYQRERVFIHGPGTTYQGPRGSKAKSQVEGGKQLTIRHKTSGPLVHINGADNSESGPLSPLPVAKITSLSLTPAYRHQIVSDFLSYTIPPPYGNHLMEERNRLLWLNLLPTRPDTTAALEAATLAVSTAKLGRVHENQVLVYESLKFYVKGLSELQRALWDPKLMYKDGTLAACMLLVMYEVMECPDKKVDGWESHMKGCSKLLESRGPDAYCSDFAHQLFIGFRAIEIQQAFVERRGTFLARSEWLERPFKDRPKSTFQKLLDLIAVVPGIVADGYKMLQGPVEGTETMDPSVMLLTILGLIDRCWKIDFKLESFFKFVQEENLGPLYWPELSTESECMDSEELGKTFPVAFKFLNLGFANMCMTYWATMAILWSGMGYTYNLLLGIQMATEVAKDGSSTKISALFDITELPPLGHRKDVAAMAGNICQSMEYCLAEDLQGAGARMAVFPLKVAIETLHDAPGCERQLLWAQAAMVRVFQSGVQIMKHLPNPMTQHAFLPG